MMDGLIDGWMNGVSFDPVCCLTRYGLDDWGALLGHILETHGLGVDVLMLDMGGVRYLGTLSFYVGIRIERYFGSESAGLIFLRVLSMCCVGFFSVLFCFPFFSFSFPLPFPFLFLFFPFSFPFPFLSLFLFLFFPFSFSFFWGGRGGGTARFRLGRRFGLTLAAAYVCMYVCMYEGDLVG